MAGVKGRSGTNRGPGKAWADALRIVGNRDAGDGKTRLMKLAEKCFETADAGDMTAIREIGDRLDGKPAQESHVTVDDKRDAADWSRSELVAFLNDAKNGSDGAAEATGRDEQPDRVH